MPRPVRILLPLLLCLVAQDVVGQDMSNRRTRVLVPTNDTLRLDTVSVAPGTFRLARAGQELGAEAYTMDPYSALLFWHGDTSSADTLIATYRALPLSFTAPRMQKDEQRMLAAQEDRTDPFRYQPPRVNEDPLGSTALNRSGSISRGVLFGNNQDLSVNSTLNLELGGRLSDNINVLASITDNNIPIQAGGNTLELQDFDQTFIKLFGNEKLEAGAGGWELIAGDFVLQRPKAYFLTYLKKTKGITGTTTYTLGKNVRSETGASAAISKGKFARTIVQGLEGVQGPYRLRGDEGESFIVVLSGTERVYVDGQLMTRGQENDYVIDYNTAELTFTAVRPITKDRRITVEFQYSDRNYTRSLVRVGHESVMGKTTVRLNAYSEQDHRNQPLQQVLSDSDKEVLALAGDDPLQAVVPGADSVAFSADLVLYRQVDSLGYTPVYVFSNDQSVAYWQLSFSNVGAGKGDYVQSDFTPNGRVFKWVPPDTVNGVIVRQGDHMPLKALIAPKTKQVVTLGVEQHFGTASKAAAEVAYSNYDRNTFSSVGDGNDEGLAAMVSAEHGIPLGLADSTLRVVVGVNAEALSSEFSIIDRYRPAEFERNWNAQSVLLNEDQLLAGANAGMSGRELGDWRYGFSTFQVRDRFNGVKHDVVADLHPGKWALRGTGSWLTTSAPQRSDFIRHKATLQRNMRWFTIGVQDEHEDNRFRRTGTDSLAVGSYRFFDITGFLQSNDTAKVKWRVSVGQRTDDALRNNDLKRSTEATTYAAQLDLSRNPRNRLQTAVNYRQLRIVDSTLTAQRPEDTWLARVDHDLTAWRGAVVTDVFYEFGSGLEQKRSFVYVEVPAGQGIYVWIDYNGDGIKDLNEFELANFGYEANYIRVFTQTNEFVRTYSSQLSASIDVRPATVWSDKDGVRKFLARFSDLASLRADRKTADNDLAAALDPFTTDPTDTSLLAYSSSLRNTLFFNRTSRAWGIDHTVQSDRTRSLLVSGYEGRSHEVQQLRLRINASTRWMVDIESEVGRTANGSDVLGGRNFNVFRQGVKPRITWQPGTQFRAALAYKRTEKNNALEFGNERALLQDLGLEIKWNTAGKGTVQANGNLVEISYDGIVDSSLGNEMLSGLKPGTNVTWNITVQRRLSSNLQVDLTYNGRKSEGINTIHVGGAQVRAFF
ncbi:MAG: hypothetical protein IPJ76_09195 [Flavobacteriales bacterium]|nr:MAG: hypothetical protein IPJ76_09195 [Flavobacteriales bacterium]